MLAKRSGPESTCRAERMRAGFMVGVWRGQDGVGGLEAVGGMGGGGGEEDVGVG